MEKVAKVIGDSTNAYNGIFVPRYKIMRLASPEIQISIGHKYPIIMLSLHATSHLIYLI